MARHWENVLAAVVRHSKTFCKYSDDHSVNAQSCEFICTDTSWNERDVISSEHQCRITKGREGHPRFKMSFPLIRIRQLNAFGVAMRSTADLHFPAVPTLQVNGWEPEPPRAVKGRTGIEETPEIEQRTSLPPKTGLQ